FAAPGVIRMLDPYEYRCPANHVDVSKCPICQGGEHGEELMHYEGADSIAAVILEPVTGTNGIIVPPDGYMQSISKICKKYGILLICDEVMCGFGRTGRWFASDHWNIKPDILTSAKGINSGYIPLGMMSVSEEISEWLKKNAFPGGLTYAGHPLACASGVAAIRAMQEESVIENSDKLGKVMRETLWEMYKIHPCIGDIRGL